MDDFLVYSGVHNGRMALVPGLNFLRVSARDSGHGFVLFV